MEDLKQWMYKRKSVQFKSQNSKTNAHNRTRKIGFVVDGRNESNLKTIQSYVKLLQDRRKDISLIFLTDHAEPEKVSFQAFNKKSFTWYRIPKAPVLIDFIDSAFDMLICINMERIPELNAIVDLSHAKFKVGVTSDESELYNLTLVPTREKTWEEYIGMMEKTIRQLSMEMELV